MFSFHFLYFQFNSPAHILCILYINQPKPNLKCLVEDARNFINIQFSHILHCLCCIWKLIQHFSIYFVHLVWLYGSPNPEFISSAHEYDGFIRCAYTSLNFFVINLKKKKNWMRHHLRTKQSICHLICWGNFFFLFDFVLALDFDPFFSAVVPSLLICDQLFRQSTLFRYFAFKSFVH